MGSEVTDIIADVAMLSTVYDRDSVKEVPKANDVSQPSRATARSYRKLYYIILRHCMCLVSMSPKVTDI